jgi:hypothetical protein
MFDRRSMSASLRSATPVAAAMLRADAARTPMVRMPRDTRTTTSRKTTV